MNAKMILMRMDTIPDPFKKYQGYRKEGRA